MFIRLKTGWSSRLSGQTQLNSNNSNNNQQSLPGIGSHQSRKTTGNIMMNTTGKMAPGRSGPSASPNRTSNNLAGSGSPSKSGAAGGYNMPISDAEFVEIEHVLKRANMVEQKELDRIRWVEVEFFCA